MIIPKADGLPEEAIEALEASIPALAATATRAAAARAMLSGLTVLKVEGAHIIACTAGGTTQVVGKAPPRRRVETGKVITVRRLTD